MCVLTQKTCVKIQNKAVGGVGFYKYELLTNRPTDEKPQLSAFGNRPLGLKILKTFVVIW